MKNNVDLKANKLSRRTILSNVVASALAGSSARLFADVASHLSGNEETDLFRVLTLWLAITNSHPSLALPISASTVEAVTGLKSTVSGDHVDTAIKYINKHQDTYNNIKKEFDKFTNAFIYTPGQCPRAITTLRKLADQNPNS